MGNLERFKEYKELCGIYTNKEMVELGEYPKSVQYLGGVLNGKYSFSATEEKRCYQAVNLARAKKLMKQANDLMEK